MLSNASEPKKSVCAVGIGPGAREFMTIEALDAIERADVVVGYTVYVELVRKIFPDKAFRSTGMTREIERCRLCFELAREGKRVALVCGGDAGVYGMASPTLEMSAEFPDVEVCVVPGVTAANSGSAILGAPLANDYCVVSLSDLLTPWDVIEKRLTAAIQGDFAIAIYNPSSVKRAGHLRKACEIMISAGADPSRACGWVENIGRDGISSNVCTLEELKDAQVNMFTTVFIGNTTTAVVNGKLVTRRGYRASNVPGERAST